MEAANILNRALKSLRFPVARIFYKGNAPTYFTFQLIAGVGTAFADDDNTATESTWRVDLYTKRDYTTLLPKVIKTLKDAGFYGVTVDAEIYEEDTKLYHVPIETKYLMEE